VLTTATVLMDLLMRLGHIAPDEEAEYVALATRMHGRFRYFMW